MFSARQNHLRNRAGHARVTNVELFFDLVFVFAVTQLSHGLLEHLTPIGAVQIAVLMMAVWWQWIDTAWITNWLDPDRPPVRLFMFALMLAALVIAAAIPRAFDDRGAVLALAYLAMQIGRDLFMLWALRRHDRNNWRNFLRITIWHRSAGRSGSRVVRRRQHAARAVGDRGRDRDAWPIARILRAGTRPFHHDGLERRGRPHGRAVQPVRHHRARRVDPDHRRDRRGTAVEHGERAPPSWSPSSGSVAMWAVYFNIGAERASRLIASSDDPGRLARSGYTYIHILIVAGIILAAVGDELVLQHPSGHASPGAVATIVGGPALYLAGNALFKRLSAPYLPLSHLVGLGLLALLVPAGLYCVAACARGRRDGGSHHRRHLGVDVAAAAHGDVNAL